MRIFAAKKTPSSSTKSNQGFSAHQKLTRSEAEALIGFIENNLRFSLTKYALGPASKSIFLKSSGSVAVLSQSQVKAGQIKFEIITLEEETKLEGYLLIDPLKKEAQIIPTQAGRKLSKEDVKKYTKLLLKHFPNILLCQDLEQSSEKKAQTEFKRQLYQDSIDIIGAPLPRAQSSNRALALLEKERQLKRSAKN